MMSETQIWESNALRNLQQASEAQGLKFYVRPPREVVPGFLGDYQPDAIALGPKGGIIIEARLRRDPATERALQQLSKKLPARKAGSFVSST